MTEDALLAAYTTPKKAIAMGVRRFDLGNVEFRPCVCGTWMGMAYDDDPSKAMRRHQETPAHRQWRAREGL